MNTNTAETLPALRPWQKQYRAECEQQIASLARRSLDKRAESALCRDSDGDLTAHGWHMLDLSKACRWDALRISGRMPLPRLP
jgi:hypothetical protein